MNNLSAMIWIETRKAIRSNVPLGTALGAILMPLGIAFLIFVSRNPEIAANLGLISAKADLMAYAATDWSTYLGLTGQMVAAGGFFLFVLVISWMFGREFADGTLKDLLAVPVQRASILLAKFAVTAIWSGALTVLIFVVSLSTGAAMQLPGGFPAALSHGGALVLVTACLGIASIMPFALIASVGRGYLLPLSVAILTVMIANFVAVIGWGEYFPWAVVGLYAQGKSTLGAVSYWIVLLTGLAGMLATYLWWKYADQNR